MTSPIFVIATVYGQIQSVEALSGNSGWMGAGLLGLVLAWLLLKHLPSKDEQIKDLLKTKDTQIENLTGKYTAALDKAVADHKQALDKVVADHKETIKLVVEKTTSESDSIRAERIDMMKTMAMERELDRKARHESNDQYQESLLALIKMLPQVDPTGKKT